MVDNNHSEFKVSVWMISYNQEKFIAEAIESVLAQKTNFPIELIIGDDCSTDRTKEIVETYRKNYPKIIKPIYRSYNIGMMKNMISTLKECSGKYVALLEADDYWIESSKLQKQVDLLEKDINISLVFHNAKVIYEFDQDRTHAFTNLENRTYSPGEIIEDWKIQTATVVFRNIELRFPNFAQYCAHGDLLLFLIIMEEGKAIAMAQTWSVYRKNEESTTLSNSFKVEYIKKVLCQLKEMNKFFKFKYSENFKIPVKYWEMALITSFRMERDYNSYIRNVYKFVCKHPMEVIKKMTKIKRRI